MLSFSDKDDLLLLFEKYKNTILGNIDVFRPVEGITSLLVKHSWATVAWPDTVR